MKRNSIMIITVLICLGLVFLAGCSKLNDFLEKETKQPEETVTPAKNPEIKSMYLGDTFFKISPKKDTVSTGIYITVENQDSVSCSLFISPTIGSIDRPEQDIIGLQFTARFILHYQELKSVSEGDVIPGTITAYIKIGSVAVDSSSINFNVYIAEMDEATGEIIAELQDVKYEK